MSKDEAANPAACSGSTACHHAKTKILVTIRGPVSAMKSPMARRIKKAVNTYGRGLTCTVFDHELFTFDEWFPDAQRRVYEDAMASEHEVCVIVIGTGCNDGPLDIRIEPGLTGTATIFRALQELAEDIDQP